jgi:hypothetical protein
VTCRAKAQKPKVSRRPQQSQDGGVAPVSALPSPARQDVRIAAAKGRPMLTWVGKRPRSQITAFPSQHIESYPTPPGSAVPSAAAWSGWPDAYPREGLLFHGDNKEALAHLLANGF